MSASARIELDVALRPRDPARLASFAAAVSTPGDPEFRRYLRPGAFGPAFGATTATVRATTTALKRLGLRVQSVSRSRLIIKVSSTVEGAERAFDTKLVRYRLGSGSVAFANSSAPRLPEAVVGGIQAVVGLSDLALPHVAGLARSSRPEDRRSARPQAGGAVETGGPLPCPEAQGAAAAEGALTADELASTYGFSGLYGAKDLGEGETVAIYELEPDLRSDIAAYQRCYGTVADVRYIKVDSGAGAGPGGGEAALDIEDVIGFAPRAIDRRLPGARQQHRAPRRLQLDRQPGSRQGDLDLVGHLRGSRRRPGRGLGRGQPLRTGGGTGPDGRGGGRGRRLDGLHGQEREPRQRACCRRSREPALRDERRRHLDHRRGPAPGRDCLERRRQRRRRRWHLVELGDARLPVGGGREPARGEALLLAQAVRSAGWQLPGGPRRLGRCRSTKRLPRLLERRLGRSRRHERSGAALGGAGGARRRLARLQCAPGRVPESVPLPDRRGEVEQLGA